MNSSERPPWNNPIGAQHVVEALEEKLARPPQQNRVEDAEEDSPISDDPETPD
jgi:hypothetical protein